MSYMYCWTSVLVLVSDIILQCVVTSWTTTIFRFWNSLSISWFHVHCRASEVVSAILWRFVTQIITTPMPLINELFRLLGDIWLKASLKHWKWRWKHCFQGLILNWLTQYPVNAFYSYVLTIHPPLIVSCIFSADAEISMKSTVMQSSYYTDVSHEAMFIELDVVIVLSLLSKSAVGLLCMYFGVWL